MDFSQIPEGHEDGREEPVFYYSREERLKRAPQIVRDYYDGKIKPYRPGLFRALVSTRANRFIFFALVVCLALVVFNIFFGPRENAETYRGIPMTLAASSFDGRVYVSLRVADAQKKFEGEYGEGIPLSVKFSPLDAENENIVLSEERLLFDADSYRGKEIFFRTVLDDFDIASVAAEIDVLGQTVTLRSKVERR